ncbi:MAG TPA: protein translocase subunit SecD [Verrucomicrobiae bacterium]|nr:protein translocase subunit SecD [Verrucomicrobiae bacterium]
MNKQFAWKFGIVAAILAASVYSMWPVDKKIKLGLDLKGGTSFLLQMDLSKIDVTGRGQAIRQAVEIIRKRVDRFGVAEPIIQPVGENRILVQLPGLAEQRQAEARQTIERTAYLEFRLVHERNEELVAESVSDPRFVPPVGYQKLVREETRDGRLVKQTYFVKVRPELTGKHVDRAYVQYSEIGQPYVALSFDPEGAAIFARVTSANVGRKLAIVLDGELYSAPVIQDAITGGHAQITGNFSVPEAQELANVLENPLEAPVKVMETRSVDPSLGRDSINSGIRAALVGSVAVVVFMAAYYLVAGVVADLALLLNMVILIGVLAMFGFTLTLPGIAGIVLTVGMAVDANVLIYERVREELAANKPLRAAIAAGYQRAFVVIFDSNFTTIMTAVILIWLGSGPVKGFGVTLTIGLLANIFAAVFVTRWVFDWLVMKGWMKSFNMLHVFRHLPHINFLGVWKLAFGLSWVLIIVGMISFVHRGGPDVGKGAVYGIDFAGGDTVTMHFVQRVDEDKLRNALNAAGFSESYIQYQRSLSGGAEVLSIKLPEGASEKVVAMLQEDFPAAQLKAIGTEHVGAVVGKELLKQALWAVAASLVAIMIYVGFRFGEFSYGLGALVSLIHDVLMTIGWFCLTGRTFSMPVVAAVLTLIGYSINDTIVVYDRIRENRKLTGGRLNYFDLINRSVNETLSRTILTAGTVFLCSVALYGFGGSVINDFAFCFMVGVLTGTYSSVYIASPVVLWFHRAEASRASKAAAKKPQPAKA